MKDQSEDQEFLNIETMHSYCADHSAVPIHLKILYKIRIIDITTFKLFSLN